MQMPQHSFLLHYTEFSFLVIKSLKVLPHQQQFTRTSSGNGRAPQQMPLLGPPNEKKITKYLLHNPGAHIAQPSMGGKISPE